MKSILVALMGLWLGFSAPAQAAGKWVETPYAPARAVLEFYLGDPQKIGTAPYRVGSLMDPLPAGA